MRDHIWEGVYKSFTEVPARDEGFHGGTWRNNSLEKISALLEASQADRFVPSVVAFNASLLPLLTALVNEQMGKVTVLDFGGSLGFTYVPVTAGLIRKDSLEYLIVDNPIICEAGERVFQNDKRIRFCTELPRDVEKVDIVHLGSSLQYVDDWRGLITELAHYRPQYFLFTDLLAGDIPTYATIQNYYGSKIPCWFLNVHELVSAVTNEGFELLLKSTYLNTYLGKQQECPQDNFPQELRLGNPCCLLFSSKAAKLSSNSGVTV